MNRYWIAADCNKSIDKNRRIIYFGGVSSCRSWHFHARNTLVTVLVALVAAHYL